MTLSNGQGIKYDASNIRMDQNLCVIRDNGEKMAVREVFREKKKKKDKKKKLKKHWKLERKNIFFWRNYFAVHKASKCCFQGENREFVSSVQLVLISLTKSHHIYDLLFINSQED